MYYYLNTNADSNGNNEVHKESCEWMPAPKNRCFIGFFNNGIEAVNYAKSIGWSNADGCFFCANEAHTG